MKLTIKDIIIIGVITILSFPVMYLSMLFVTGNAKIVLASKEQGNVEGGKKLKYMKHSKRKDSLIISHSQAFLASAREREEVEKEREQLVKQQERINMLVQELDRTRQDLLTERAKFEDYIEKNDQLEDKRIKQLAKVYGAMRANEAAQILETLNDKLLVQIFTSMSDDRQKAKIMSNLSKEKAGRISRILGTK